MRAMQQQGVASTVTTHSFALTGVRYVGLPTVMLERAPSEASTIPKAIEGRHTVHSFMVMAAVIIGLARTSTRSIFTQRRATSTTTRVALVGHP